MNLLLLTEDDRLTADSYCVRGRRLAHLRQVLRPDIGDRLRVGVIDGLQGEGLLVELDDERAIINVTLTEMSPPRMPVWLVLALPRPKMLRRILRSVAEFGVAELHLIHSYRVEKSYWQTPALRDDALREYLAQGLEQARDTRMPAVYCHRRFKTFAEDTLPVLIAGKRALLAHPGVHARCPSDTGIPTVLLLGPEGGFIQYEVHMLQSLGCETVSLGARTLRVENAVSAALGRFS